MPFAAYPSAVVYSKPGEKNRKNAVQQVIWGDWITLQGPPQGEWIPVRARRENGWMDKNDI